MTLIIIAIASEFMKHRLKYYFHMNLFKFFKYYCFHILYLYITFKKIIDWFYKSNQQHKASTKNEIDWSMKICSGSIWILDISIINY